MSKSYYETLGVSKTATKDEIKKAFRKLAHQYHPDKQGGDEAKFKEANEAYQVLSDDQKRAQYDQFGSAGPGGFGGGFQGGQGFGGFDFSGFQNGQGMEFDLNDIFEGFFGGGGFGGRRVVRGRNIQLGLTLTFKESILGTKKKIKIPSESAMASKKEVEIDIPGGIENGQKMKLSGYGESVQGGQAHSTSSGQAGDLYIFISVPEHPVYRKEGYHLVRTLEVKLTDAILGAKYDIETLDGNVSVKIPKGINTGTILRIKGEGVKVNSFQSGDILLQIRVQIPSDLTKEQKKLIEELQKTDL